MAGLRIHTVREVIQLLEGSALEELATEGTFGSNREKRAVRARFDASRPNWQSFGKGRYMKQRPTGE